MSQELKRGQRGNFEFIGNIEFNKEDFSRDRKSAKNPDWTYSMLNFYICNGENKIRISLSEGYSSNSKLYKMTKEDNETIIIDFKDRMIPTIMDKVADFSKFRIGIEKTDVTARDEDGNIIMENGEPKTYKGWKYVDYISAYDFVNHLGQILTEKPNMRVRIKGSVTYSLYDNKVQTKYNINNFYILTEEDKFEDKMYVKQEVLIDKDSLSEAKPEEIDGIFKAKIKAYTYQYVNKNERALIPFNMYYVFEKVETDKVHKYLKGLFAIKDDRIRRITLEGTPFTGKVYQSVAVELDNVSDDLKAFLGDDYNIDDVKEQLAKSHYSSVVYVNEFRLHLVPPIIKNEESGKIELNISDNEFTKEDLMNLKIEEKTETKKTTKPKETMIETDEIADLDDFFSDDDDDSLPF